MSATPDPSTAPSAALKRRFAIALCATPLLIGGFGGVMMLLAPLFSGDVQWGLREVGQVLGVSALAGALSYFTAGGVCFWILARRGERRVIAFVGMAFVANFFAILLVTAPVFLFSIFMAPTHWNAFGTTLIVMFVHAAGFVFAPL